MHITNDEAVLTKLGYKPNDALSRQLEKIKTHTQEYDKIIKHILDLHDALAVDKSYVALSNSQPYFKIKIEAGTEAMKEEALQKVHRFSEKFKVKLQKVDAKETYYILGFER